MSLQSMTGFARSQRTFGAWRLAWEIKSVNAKGLDLRLRTPPGFDALEQEARNLIGKKLTRGACYATLTAQRESAAPEIRVNEAALASLVDAIGKLPASDNVRPASLDGLLAIKGVVDIVDSARFRRGDGAGPFHGARSARGSDRGHRRHAQHRGQGAA